MPQNGQPSKVPVPVPVPGSVSTVTDPGPSSATAVLTRRRPVAQPREKPTPRHDGASETETVTETAPADGTMSWTARNQWIVYAVASGACAAFNGVFAKLTTNDLTAHIGRRISDALGLGGFEKALEVAVRVMFFGLNLVFNGVMWTLFTKALARGTSTTQVSIMNTSTNFVITALLGLAIFAESLPPLWWAGAALLVAGNVIIGRKNEGDADAADDVNANASAESVSSGDEAAERGEGGIDFAEFKDEVVDDDVPLLGDLDSPRGT
ncbi:hypothetical protein F4861DRAFT_36736 [Xylaria intraflava]|nr:hypothetical protein F4861DRAFT_36736 [Xylaria intraflava]